MSDSSPGAPTDGAPSPEDCKVRDDIGKFYYDEAHGVSYECIYDPRRDVVTWAIVPAVE